MWSVKISPDGQPDGSGTNDETYKSQNGNTRRVQRLPLRHITHTPSHTSNHHNLFLQQTNNHLAHASLCLRALVPPKQHNRYRCFTGTNSIFPERRCDEAASGRPSASRDSAIRQNPRRHLVSRRGPDFVARLQWDSTEASFLLPRQGVEVATGKGAMPRWDGHLASSATACMSFIMTVA